MRVALVQCDRCPLTREIWTQTHREKCHMTTGAEIAVMLPQAKERPGVLAATRSWGGRKDSPLELRGNASLPPP